MADRAASYRNGPGYERRIGARQPVESVWFDWEPPRGRTFLRRKNVERAEIKNLSITGAGVIAKSDPALRTGVRVKVGYNGTDGVIEIRSHRPTEDPRLTYYGVTFVEGEIIQAVARLIGVRDVFGEQVWRTSFVPGT